MEFILTAEELNICLSNAFKKKYSHASKQKINLENFIVGNLGEMAYSKYSGLPMDLTIYESVKGDGGIDFPDNTQVKTVTWTGPNKLLKVSKKDLEKYKKIGIKQLVLAAVDAKNVNKILLVGAITLENFIINMIEDERFADCYVVSENHLTPLP
jgi:hypothetical protein